MRSKRNNGEMDWEIKGINNFKKKIVNCLGNSPVYVLFEASIIFDQDALLL